MIEALHKKYVENVKKFLSLENHKYSGDDIVTQIKAKSLLEKLIKDENNDIIQKIQQYGKAIDKITITERQELEDFAFELSNHKQFLDPMAASIIRSILLDYAKYHNDTDDIIKQLCELGETYFFINYRNTMSYKVSYYNPYYNEIRKYESLYDTASPKTKGYILLGHNNAISHQLNLSATDWVKVHLDLLAYNRELKNRYPNEYLDSDYDHTTYAYNSNITTTIYKFIDGETTDAFITNEVYKASVIALNNVSKRPRTEPYQKVRFEFLKLVAMYCNNMISLEELMRLTEPMTIPNENDGASLVIYKTFHLNALYTKLVFKREDYSDEEKHKKLDQSIDFALKYAKELSVIVDQYIMDRALITFLDYNNKITKYEKFKKEFFTLVVYRHKPTYVHTMTICEISEAIARVMLKTNPEFFANCFENRISDNEEIINRLREMAMMHDVGKLGCLSIVQNFSRDLTDNEYKIIKQHPLFGLKLIPKSTPKYITDAILYHHVWHNGKGGYPNDLPPTNNQPLIDIISIADSLDAATDNIGRPYSKVKTLEALITEFNEFKGTRYSEEVINALNDQLLQDKIKDILYEEREALIQKVYSSN